MNVKRRTAQGCSRALQRPLRFQPDDSHLHLRCSAGVVGRECYWLELLEELRLQDPELPRLKSGGNQLVASKKTARGNVECRIEFAIRKSSFAIRNFHRQQNRKGRSLAPLARHRHLPTVRLDDGIADG